MTTRIPTVTGRVIVAAASANDERALVGWITDSGLEVVSTTQDGDEAIKAALAQGVDLVVANVNLTGASGLEVAEQLWARAPQIGCVLVADAASWGAHRRAMRAGALDFLQPPLGADEAESLRSAIRQVYRRRELLPERIGPASGSADAEGARGVLIGVFSAKGGVGRSFVAANVAASLATKSDALLCDLDLQFGDIASWGPEPFGERTVGDLAAVARAGEVTENDLRSVAHTRFGGVQVLASPRFELDALPWSVCLSGAGASADPSAGDGTFPAAELVTAIRQWSPWTVVDNMPGLFDPAVAVFPRVDLALVVTTCEVGALRATRSFLDRLDRIALVRRIVVANRANRGENSGLVARALGPSERIVYVDEDLEFGRGLVIDGVAAPRASKRRAAKALEALAQEIAANFAPAVPT